MRVLVVAEIIAVATDKGGDGKTTVSTVLTDYLSLILKKRTLGIDLDAQLNYSSRYISVEIDPACKDGKMPSLHPDYEPDVDVEWDGRSSIANIFYGEEVVPYPTKIQNLDVMPGYASKLRRAEVVTSEELLKRLHIRLKEFLMIPEIQNEYDVIIIDTPGTKGPLTTAAIKAASHMVIPCQMEKYSVDGLYAMLQLWKQETYVRSQGDKLELVGILPNRVRNVSLHNDYLQDLNRGKIKNYVCPHNIKERIIYSEILSKDEPQNIFSLPKNHVARQESERVCNYIVDKVFNHG